MYKRFFYSFLIFTMLILLFSGCQKTATTAQSKTTGTEMAESTTLKDSTHSNFNSEGYPIVNEPVTYNFLISNNFITNPNEQWALAKKLEDMTNVHIEWTVVSSADLTTKKSLMWASNDYPDVLTDGAVTMDDITTYGPMEVLIPLNDLIKKYMPNFVAGVNNYYPTIFKALTLEDGNIYSLPRVRHAAMADGTGFYINKTWLNKLGLEIPSTTEELFDILVAFRDNDPNGNNKKDEIPLAIDINTTWANGAINAWFGTGLNENIIIIDEKVYYSPIMDEYKTYVKYLNRLWKAELLDQELFTQDAATFSAKAKLEPNIYGSFMHYREGQILADGNKNYELVLPLDGGTGRYGAIKSIYKEMSAALNMAAITKSAKNPEILARWFDVFMDPYYGQQIIKGPVGTLLEETPDGLLKFVDEIPPQYKNQIEWQNAARLQLLPSLCSQKYNAWFDDNDPILIELAARKKAYGPYYFNDVMPLGFPTKSETEVRVKYGTDLSKYAKEMFALWVTGERDINADWDGYKKQMENLYVNEYMESFQTMYDRLK